ncbi:MAG: multicopper oxidase domain-containing protein, partial [Bacteroidota bacterium]
MMKEITMRRPSATLLALLAFLFFAPQIKAQNPLFIPDTLTGPVYNLELAPGKMAWLPGDSTITHGINQDYLGPTLIMNKGDNITLNVTNSIVDTTTMHWHGMHVAPSDDGGPHTTIVPGDTWSPDFEVLDEATTFWYHPHLHYKTAQHVYSGASGMIILRDTHEAALPLPRTYGVDDFPIIIQDKAFNANNQLIFAEVGDTVMINGTMNPFLEVPAQMVRFRLLNGSNQRVYNFAVPNNLNAFQIGTDGGLLSAPLPITRMRLAPGERAEIVIDFGPQPLNSVIPMSCNNSELGPGITGGQGGPQGGPGNLLDNQDFAFIEFRVRPPHMNGVNTLPPNLNTYAPWDENDADLTRIKTFDTIPPAGFPYLINSTPFNLSVVNDTLVKDAIEIWEIRNETDIAHPFHIHDIQFYVIEFNGNPPPPHWRGKKDLVLLEPGDV